MRFGNFNINKKEKMKKVLIYGGAGYIGCVLTQQLLDLGYKVKVCDILRKGGKPLVNFITNPNFEFDLCDCSKKEDVIRNSKDVDYIILLAGVVGLNDCNHNPEITRIYNVDAWKIVSENSGNIPIISAGTGSVYGKVDGVCTEDTSTNPLSLYAETKLEGEKFVLDRGGLVFRYATAGGISPQMRFNLLPNELTFDALRSGTIKIFEANNLRTFIDIRDFCRSLIFGCENFNKMKYRLYNVGSNSNNLTKGELCEIIQRKTGCELQYNEFDKDPDARDYKVDYKKINDEGFYCNYSMEDMIDSLVQCYSIWRD